MTASRALREGTSVRAEVRARVRQAAARLGYHQDRLVSEVMTSFARQNVPAFRETLAALWWESWPELESPVASFNREMRRGLHRGAERFGCRIDDILIPSVHPGRVLSRMFTSRGISGVLILPPLREDVPAPELPWDRLTAVTIGSSLRTPDLNRAQHHHYNAMSRVLRETALMGYRRPALLVQKRLEERTRRAYLGAYLAWQGAEHANLVHPDARHDDPSLPTWLKRVRADAVIAENEQLLASLVCSGRLSPSLGLVCLDVNEPSGPTTGIFENTQRTAESAVELLVHARLRRESGLPAEPLILMNEGIWVPGSTMKPRGHRG